MHIFITTIFILNSITLRKLYLVSKIYPYVSSTHISLQHNPGGFLGSMSIHWTHSPEYSSYSQVYNKSRLNDPLRYTHTALGNKNPGNISNEILAYQLG